MSEEEYNKELMKRIEKEQIEEPKRKNLICPYCDSSYFSVDEEKIYCAGTNCNFRLDKTSISRTFMSIEFEVSED